MTLFPRPRLHALLLAAAALLPAAAALARAPHCVTARSQCPVRGTVPPGTHCACPDHPGVWGMVDTMESGEPMYPAFERHTREGLRNDDLQDGDDVLAGPRWHGRRRNSDDVYP